MDPLISRWVIETPLLDPLAKRVYMSLCHYLGSNPWVSRSYAQLMQEIGCTQAAVRRAVTTLENGGIVRVERRGTAGNRYYPIRESAVRRTVLGVENG